MKSEQILKKSLLILTCCIVVSKAYAQVTIDECIALAKKNYPLYGGYELAEMGHESDLKINKLKWVPQLSVNAKVSYQSEVVEMPFSIPGYEFDISHYQYGTTIDLNQMIWDGGATKNNRDMILANRDISLHQVDVALYSLNERVETLFLGILLLDREIVQNDVLMESLLRKRNEVEAWIEGGVAYRSDLDMVNVNILNCRQQKTELLSNRDAYMEMLEILTGRELAGERLVEPETEISGMNREIARPELRLYDAQLFQNGIMEKELSTRISPKFNITLQGGIGRPGLNMLSNEIQSYFVTGIKMQWDIGPLCSLKNDRKKIEIQRQNIENEKAAFILNLSLEMTEQLRAIEKIRETLKMDDEIISMRERIRCAGEEHYANGVIKMIDLMAMMDDEYNAKVNKSVHEIQLMMAVRKFDNIRGE